MGFWSKAGSAVAGGLGYSKAKKLGSRWTDSHHQSSKSIEKDIKEAKKRTYQTSPYTPGQQKLIDYMNKAAIPGSKQSQQMGGDLRSNPLYQKATGLLGNYLNPSQDMMNQMNAPMMRQFNEQTMPGIAQQYASAGLGNSTSFQNAAVGAGTDLQERLNAQHLNVQQNALGQALGYANAPFQNNLAMQNAALGHAPIENNMVAPQQKGGIFRTLLPALSAAGGAFAGSYAGNPEGGAQAGQAFGSQMAQGRQYQMPQTATQRQVYQPINSM